MTLRNRLMLFVAAALTFAACTTAAEPAPEGSTTTTGDSPTSTTSERSYAGVDPAPEFPAGLDWLNTPGPLTLEALRGKVVLLDFWTYGCINCIHIIPDLERLEAEYPDELVVIGVHSAKFTNEGSTENIRQIVLRYGLEHPVVNDRDFTVWNTWGANAWPTIVVIDPAGNIVGGFAGEGVYVRTKPVIESLVAEFDAAGLLDRSPVPLTPEADRAGRTLLSFPEKLLADETAGRLFIADTGNHRVVVADLETGEVTAVFGQGRPGFRDGSALTARFNSPRGLALSPDGEVLFVADTDNHSVRTVDLDTGEVGLLVGTGQIGWPPQGGFAPDVALNSPWDLAVSSDALYVANAGTHQIWRLDFGSGATAPLVGSSKEGVENGLLIEAELAQPSGLAFGSGGRLYFADAESSSIRYADVEAPDGLTGVVAGTDRGLFDFGDIDGVGTAALLQHPLAVVFDESRGRLIIADTYNSKLKTIDPSNGATTTWLGGEQGWADGASPLFYEPGGLSISGDSLYVADTNNHSVRVVDLESGTTGTLVLKGIERFAPPAEDDDYLGEILTVDEATVASGPGIVRLVIDLPEGYKVNEEAPSSITWSVAGSGATFSQSTSSLTGATFPVDLGVEFASGDPTITGDLTLIYCRDDAESLCLIEQVRFVVPVRVTATGPSGVITLSHAVTAPEL